MTKGDGDMDEKTQPDLTEESFFKYLIKTSVRWLASSPKRNPQFWFFIAVAMFFFWLGGRVR